MIYKFKSKAAGDVIMLKPGGDHVLRIIGKEPGPRGIITLAEMPAAIAALEAAIRREAHAPQDKKGGSRDDEDVPVADERVSLQQRAWPLVEMLKEAQAGQADIVWGV
jgi:hypothetical protein